MAKIKSIKELESLRAAILKKRDPKKPGIDICGGTGCLAYGCDLVISAFKDEVKRQGLEAKVNVKVSGCPGFCEQGPIVVIRPQNIFYPRAKVGDVPQIVSESVVKGKPVEKLLFVDPATGAKVTYESEVPFYKKQKRLILEQSGFIDPMVIEDYFAVGGYAALAKALSTMTPEQIIAQVKKSGLRGRGGAGFPTGVKWETTRRVPSDIRYVIVNADEGDPGAFANRSLLEGNPHSVLEGLIIGAYAIGSSQGYIYVRHE